MAWYHAGSVAVTNGQPKVTGTGTAFVDNVQAGHAIILSDGRPYEIANVVSNTELTLGRPYLGATGAGLAYDVVPTQGFAQSVAARLAAFTSQYEAFITTVLAGRFGDGSVAAPGLSWAGDQDTGFYRSVAKRTSFASGGVRTLEMGPVTTTFAESAGATALDMVGRASDSSAYARFLDAGRSLVTAFLAFDASSNLSMTAVQGSARIAAAAGAAVLLRIGAVDKVAVASDAFRPITDNAIALGAGGLRFSVVYAASGAIQTSDNRLKQWRGPLTADELAAAVEIIDDIGIYQMLDEIERKGDAARLHVGIRAQETAAIFTAHGLDPYRYGINCYDEWQAVAATPGTLAVPAEPEVRDDEGRLIRPAQPAMPAQPGTAAQPAGDRYSIRYDELFGFLIAGMHHANKLLKTTVGDLLARVDLLESRLTA